MKKRLFVLASTIVMLLVVCLASFAGCFTSPKDIDNFLEKLQKADSMEMVMTMDIPMAGSMTNTIKVDGNKSFSSSSIDESAVFTEVVEDKLHIYTQYGNTWREETYPIQDNEEIPSETESFEVFFDSDNYTYSSEDKAFKLKDGKYIDFEGMRFSSVLLKLNLNSCVLTCQVNMEGVPVDCTIEIKNINKTKLSKEDIVGN